MHYQIFIRTHKNQSADCVKSLPETSSILSRWLREKLSISFPRCIFQITNCTSRDVPLGRIRTLKHCSARSWKEKRKRKISSTIERKKRNVFSSRRDATTRYVVRYVDYGLLLRKRRCKNALSTERENRLAFISAARRSKQETAD